MPDFPKIPNFLNENITLDSKFNKYGINLKSNIEVDVRDSKISNDKSEIKIELKIYDSIEGDIYINILDESNYEESEVKIELEKNKSIEGNIYITLNGRIEETEFEFELDEGANITGNIFIKGTGSEVQIELDKDSSLNGSIYISGKYKEIEIELSQNASINGSIHSDAKVMKEFELELKEGSLITGNIYSDARVEDEFEFEGNGTINGVIFVPYSKLEFDEGIKVNGAVIGKQVKIKNATITYQKDYLKSSVLDLSSSSLENGHGYEGCFK